MGELVAFGPELLGQALRDRCVIGFDFGREFITEIQEPAARERCLRRTRFMVFRSPPRVQRGKKLPLTGCMRTLQRTRFVEDQRVAGRREQDVETATLTAGRSALQQEWITLGKQAMQVSQVAGTCDLAEKLSQVCE